MRRVRIGHRLAGLAVLLLCSAAMATELEVGYYDFGVAADGETPAQFADSIDASEAFDARMTALPLDPTQWRTVPQTRAPLEWLSLVRAKTGQACDFMVFQFSDRDATVAYAARRPSRVRQVQYWFSVPPGPHQIPMNAIRECATDFLFTRTGTALERTAVQIVLQPWTEDGNGMGGLQGSVTQTPRTLKPVEALAYCAAYEAGWRPTAAGAPDSITLAVREEVSLYYSLRCTHRRGDRTRSLIRHNIPRERIYETLARVFLVLGENHKDLVFGDLGSYEARMLNWVDGTVLVADGLTLRALNPASGSAPWSLEAVSEEARFIVNGRATTRRTVCAIDNGLAAVITPNGRATRLAPVQPPDAGSFAVLTSNTAAIAEQDGIALYRDGTREYVFEGKDFIPPLLAEGPLLVTANRKGGLLALRPSDRQPAWTTPLDDVPELLASDGRLLLAATAETLYALDPASGSVLWQHAAGDRLVCEPGFLPSRVVIATKAGDLRVLDRATGAPVAERKWPTWITALGVSQGADTPTVACLDIQNVVTILSAEDLETRRRIAFPWSLEPILVAAVDVPREWRNEAPAAKDELIADLLGDMGEAGPAWLLTDRAGFACAIPIGKGARP